MKKTKFLATLLSGAIGISTASAAEVQIFTNEQREENANKLILDFDDSGGNVHLQFGETLGEEIYWDSAAGKFIITDDVNITDNLDVDGTITTGTGNVQITNVDGTIDGDKIADDSIDQDALDFGTGIGQISGLDVPLVDNFDNSNQTNIQGVLEDTDTAIGDRTYTEQNYITDGESVASSLDALDIQLSNANDNVANLGGTNANAFILDQDDTGGNVVLQFGTTLNEQFYWDEVGSTFVLTDDLDITGNITLTGTVDGVDVAGLDTTVQGHLDGGANKHDATEIDVETAGNITTAANLETNLASFDTAIGDRVYTNDNNISDGQVITGSLDALDTAIGDRTFTNENYVANGQTLTEAINALDTALGTDSVRSEFVAMNDLTVQEDGTNNTANLYNDSETGANPHQYYSLKTTQASLQDLTLKYKVKLPENFKNFSGLNDISFFYKNTGVDETDSAIDILVEDKDGDDAYLAADGQGLFSAAWAEYSDEFDNVDFNPVAGDYIYVTVKAYGSYAAGYQSPFVGELVLKYEASVLN